VVVGGTLSNNKGINKKGGGLSAKALTDKDKADLKTAVSFGVDYIAISFPRSADDMNEAKALITASGSQAGVIAKIERKEAIDELASIIAASDAVMVARGDLGVEIGDAVLPGIQKRIIHLSRSMNKPVITATQMMESMITNPIPTRAEISDVANAVLDGTDAVMLSAETATGAYPAETVAAMARVCLAAEKEPEAHISRHRVECQFAHVDEAIAMSTMYTANHIDVSAIIALTESGATPLWMSRIRSSIPIYGLSRHVATQRRIALYRGVYPLAFDPTQYERPLINQKAVEVLESRGLVKKNDLVIITKGDLAGVHGKTNSMKIFTVGMFDKK
jgi:pyruvate kinase